MTAYSSEDDLLIGDILLPPGFDKQKFVDGAAEEMDSKLGFVYQLPLEGVGGGQLPLHERLLLKTINNKLASGRFIMDVAIGGEQQTLHAYGLRLTTEAMNDLMCIANGDVDLSAVRITPVGAEPNDRMKPSVTNHDEESLLLAFENTVMRGRPWYSRPGAL